MAQKGIDTNIRPVLFWHGFVMFYEVELDISGVNYYYMLNILMMNN